MYQPDKKKKDQRPKSAAHHSETGSSAANKNKRSAVTQMKTLQSQIDNSSGLQKVSQLQEMANAYTAGKQLPVQKTDDESKRSFSGDSEDENALAFSDYNNHPLIKEAIDNYKKLEEPGLKKKKYKLSNPMTWETLGKNYLKESSLFNRLGRLRNTTFEISVVQNQGGYCGLTQLFGLSAQDSFPEQYDSNPNRFQEMLGGREVNFFRIEIYLNTRPAGNFTSAMWLQTFAHEMTVHAENIVNYIEGYWQYFDQGGQQLDNYPPLQEPDLEHQNFHDGDVESYELIKKRFKRKVGSKSKEFGEFSKRDGKDKEDSLPKDG